MVKKRKNLVWSIAFILPALSLLFVFLLYPVFEAVKLSFYKWTGIASAKPIFIGLENYKAVFQSPNFWLSMRNALFFMIGGFLILMPLAFLLAKIITSSIREMCIRDSDIIDLSDRFTCMGTCFAGRLYFKRDRNVHDRKTAWNGLSVACLCPVCPRISAGRTGRRDRIERQKNPESGNLASGAAVYPRSNFLYILYYFVGSRDRSFDLRNEQLQRTGSRICYRTACCGRFVYRSDGRIFRNL